MLIQLEKWTFDSSKSYKIKYINPCCEEITHNSMIDFRSEYFENCENDNYGVAICEADTHPEPYEDYYTTDYRYYKINNCPFCGKPILIEVINTVDKTEEYLALQKEVYSLRKKINRCDSKKKCFELEAEFRDKNNKLNDYYIDGSIHISVEEDS